MVLILLISYHINDGSLGQQTWLCSESKDIMVIAPAHVQRGVHDSAIAPLAEKVYCSDVLPILAVQVPELRHRAAQLIYIWVASLWDDPHAILEIIRVTLNGTPLLLFKQFLKNELEKVPPEIISVILFTQFLLFLWQGYWDQEKPTNLASLNKSLIWIFNFLNDIDSLLNQSKLGLIERSLVSKEYCFTTMLGQKSILWNSFLLLKALKQFFWVSLVPISVIVDLNQTS